MQANATMEAIHVQRGLAKDFRQPSGSEAARQLHLPEAILGVTEALAEEGVERILRGDVRDAPDVAHDLDRRAEPFQPDLAVQRRQGSPQQIAERSGGERARRSSRNAQPACPAERSVAWVQA